MGFRRVMKCALGAMSLALVLAVPAMGEPSEQPMATETLEGQVIAGDLVFDSWSEYFDSDYFRDNGLRCGISLEAAVIEARLGGSANDCSFSSTNPSPVYDPAAALYLIPVVVHVIQNSGGTGFLTAAQVESQIDILNEDFLALAGTPGQNGSDVQIQFYLATEDPSGTPTTGITYSTNTTWFNDGGGYYNTLAWDTNIYLNMYSNTAGGFLGYVPDLPQGGIAGSDADRVVIHYQSFGRNSPGGQYNQGRTATHEVGHYLGLYHTFQSGCGTSSCYTTGDRICDTNAEANPRFSCAGSSCGNLDPYRNYMDYSNDTCMDNFTPEQGLRMRCSLEHYRPNLYELGSVAPCAALDVRSCKVHGALGLLCLDMGVVDGVEPRDGGVFLIEIDVDDASGFNGVDSVDCKLFGDATANVNVAVVNGNTITVGFSPELPANDTCTVTLDCGTSVCVSSIHGDIDRNGTTSTGDASIIKPNFGADASAVGPQYDYNLDGVISTGDASLIKPNFGLTAPSCP